MANNIFARIASGVVAELIQIDASLDPTKIFGTALTLVNVTANNPAVTLGMTAAETNGAWAFAAPAAPAAPTPIVPTEVTAFQAKAALLAMQGAETGKTLLDDVNAWVATGSPLLQLAWNEAATITRTGTFVSQAAAKFAWTGAQLDAMFTSAAAIQA